MLGISLTSRSQPPGQPQSTDSVNRIRLKTGEIIHSRIRLRKNSSDEKYLLLDDDRQLFIDQVDRYSTRWETFVTVPGSAGTDIYRVEREGSRISLYSRLIIDPYRFQDSGYTPTRLFFFRKTGQEKMTPETYTGLMNAMADNPASTRQLRIMRTQMAVGGTIAVASFIVAVIAALTHHPSNPKFDPPAPPQITWPYMPPPSPTPPGPTRYKLSPLVPIGGAVMLGGLVFALTAHHHEYKALDIYNQ